MKNSEEFSTTSIFMASFSCLLDSRALIAISLPTELTLITNNELPVRLHPKFFADLARIRQ
jgi:hypothetical protein